uniref:Two-component response regulator-like APRR2 isoform X2 n=1 Tax=Rhizophora mucronata TaxID=61149 RepID=A0A2P2M051_RHIMU
MVLRLRITKHRIPNVKTSSIIPALMPKTQVKLLVITALVGHKLAGRR